MFSERYRFKGCKQSPYEEMKSYVGTLMKLSENCEFGAQLEDSVRDQFVWGRASENMKGRLIREKDLTFKKALELATSMEAAGREVKEMSGTSRKATKRNDNEVKDDTKKKRI